MRLILSSILILSCINLYSQSINLNENFINNYLRSQQIAGNLDSNSSFTLLPLDSNILSENNIINYKLNLISNKKETIYVGLLPIDYLLEFNSKYPYNRNNGSMIPNRGYQHIISLGLIAKVGPLHIEIKPEHHYSENRNFQGFWDNHYPEIWLKRYELWNRIDMPERFGNKSHNNLLIGQSSIKLKFGKIELGISNKNIWWGPSKRNSIMMSNHARGFKHITLNSKSPMKTSIGNFEWQIITGRLEPSFFTPPRTDFLYNGRKIYVPKINQRAEENDWRYLQAYTLTYSPKWIDGLHIGYIRWVQMYRALVEGGYPWLEGNPTYFPAFSNIFRKRDKFKDYEEQTDQAAGLFLRWLWKESNFEIYAEFHYNDAKQNLRDLILDSDHSRASTLGFEKIFNKNNDGTFYSFGWEWTQMEQTAGRLLRPASSWYMHGYVYHGFTNNGEVLGSSIGPGSNSHFFSLKKFSGPSQYKIALEIIDNDNDFYYEAFESAKDFRRYWKDINLHIGYNKIFKKFWFSGSLVYSRSLNYQWGLDDSAIEPYYRPGVDINNFHSTIKLTYFFD